MRGKHLNQQFLQHNHRITPADAGKTCFSVAGAEPQRDHPRGCGENFYSVGLAAYDTGSPPRMRGKHMTGKHYSPTRRITPADAGKTTVVRQAAAIAWDHPRGCGENRLVLTFFPCGLGSPPRMRGKPFLQCKVFLQYRITPADAGKTRARKTALRQEWDHPRGCGENTAIIPPMTATRGSPPRMRGKRQQNVPARRKGGITPADAGKTNQQAAHNQAHRDHPRGCGENYLGVGFALLSLGSPPRMRGKHGILAVLNETSGITPADAGKTRYSADSLMY